MTNEEYIAVQQQLVLLAQLVAEINVEGMLERLERADAIGPLFHPSEWMKAKPQLDEVRKLAEAAMVFRREALRQMEAQGAKGGATP